MRNTERRCKIAFLRHATSKVKYENDLDSISTLGFRGEALASICAVSRLQLITRNINEEEGTSYIIEGGEEVSLDEAGCPVGTTFIIRDLFYNIPARAKFLKKDVAEGNAVSNVIDKTALSHPEIAFTYIKDGKQVLKTFGDGKLLSAIYAVFGKDFANGMIPVDYQLDGIKVYGYVSKPINSRPNRNMLNFFINGRYVKTKTGIVAVEEAFKGSIMVGKFPSCVLNMELPYEMIDVNVHPAKIEVRFINERPVFDTIYHAVKSALMKNDSRKQATFMKETAFNDIKKFNPFNNAEAILNSTPKEKTDTQPVSVKPTPKPAEKKDDFNPFENIIFTQRPKQITKPKIEDVKVSDSKKSFIIEEKPIKEITIEQKPIIDEKPVIQQEVIKTEEKSEPVPLIKQDEVFIRYIGEAFNTYIIAEKNNKEILLVDKHAAHERMIYEKLKAEKAGTFSQMLLQPVTVTLDKSEYISAISNLDIFSECAFEVEDFGNSTVIVRSIPQYIDVADVNDCIVEMAEHMASGKNDVYSEKMDWFYHNVACRSAIKAGNKSTVQELVDIIKKLEENPQLKYCPHGRPICIAMTKNEIEKQFGRV